MEVVLFNGFLSGGSLVGDRFFYRNILESGGGPARRPDRRVPCCHGSFCRTVPQVLGYMYAHAADDLYVTLYAANHTEVALSGGKVQIKQETDYPFDGKIVLTVTPKAAGQKFNLRLRIPTWAQERFMPEPCTASLRRRRRTGRSRSTANRSQPSWKRDLLWSSVPGKPVTRFSSTLSMPVQISTSTDKIEAYRHRVAVSRGPLLYCAEEVDNSGPVQRLSMSRQFKADQAKLSTISDGLLQGMKMVSLPGIERTADKNNPVTINFVPYHSWENRGAKTMSVWIPEYIPGQVLKQEMAKWIPASDTKPPRSSAGTNSAIIFENKSAQRVKVYWISYKGQKKTLRSARPRQDPPAKHIFQEHLDDRRRERQAARTFCSRRV